MLHPALHLLTSRPAWLAEHAEAYAELATAELADAAARARRMLLVGVLSLSALGVGAVLAGVALMLWAVTPDLPERAGWLLLATPAVPLAAALLGLMTLRRDSAVAMFLLLRQQLQADLLLLREARTP